VTNANLEAARTGNLFLERPLLIARLDKLSRDEDVQQKLQAPDCCWDLVICDEAHKMSATVFGGEAKYTKRYNLGRLLSRLTRRSIAARSSADFAARCRAPAKSRSRCWSSASILTAETSPEASSKKYSYGN
jgi:hypothetical protein